MTKYWEPFYGSGAPRVSGMQMPIVAQHALNDLLSKWVAAGALHKKHQQVRHAYTPHSDHDLVGDNAVKYKVAHAWENEGIDGGYCMLSESQFSLDTLNVDAVTLVLLMRPASIDDDEWSPHGRLTATVSVQAARVLVIPLPYFLSNARQRGRYEILLPQSAIWTLGSPVEMLDNG